MDAGARRGGRRWNCRGVLCFLKTWRFTFLPPPRRYMGETGANAASIVIAATACCRTGHEYQADFDRLEAGARWLSRQASSISSTFHGARKSVENLGDNAGDTARTTVDGAKGAADAVVRIP